MQIDKAGTTAYFSAIPNYNSAANATADLVDQLRSTVIPKAEHGTDMLARVGGSTAGYVDLAARISSKLPLQIVVVIALSFVLLILAFRTVVIPAQAAVMNVLSIAASYGVLTAIFQYGWLSGAIGLSSAVPIVSYVPLFMFAILFGLSMDYEVFLVTRIYEEWHRRRDNREAVAHGLAATGRTITAAAAIMILVFAAFILGGQRIIDLFGVGLASAVLLDALIVRSALVPALMLELGEANWWLPAWLEQRLPHLRVEGATARVGARHAPAERAVPEPSAG